MVMLQVRQFSSAEGKGRSSHPKSGTVSLKGPGPDQTQLLSLSKFDKKYFYYENFIPDCIFHGHKSRAIE